MRVGRGTHAGKFDRPATALGTRPLTRVLAEILWIAANPDYFEFCRRVDVPVMKGNTIPMPFLGDRIR